MSLLVPSTCLSILQRVRRLIAWNKFSVKFIGAVRFVAAGSLSWPQGVSPSKLGSSTMSSTVTFDGGRRGWAKTILRQLCKKYGHVHTSHFAELEASLRARAEAEAVASLSAHG